LVGLYSASQYEPQDERQFIYQGHAEHRESGTAQPKNLRKTNVRINGEPRE